MKFASLKKYLRETSLHGYGYADDQNIFFIIFWALLTATCVYYSIHDILPLVRAYQLVPTVVSVSVTPNLNAILPTPTLCMETMLMPPDYNFTTDNFITDINADIAAFMSATNNGENLNINSTEMQLTDRLEYMTYLMLGYITDFELLYTGDQKPMFTDYVNKYVHRYNYNFWVTDATSFQQFVQPAYEAYMTYKISLSNLKRLVGMSICNKQIGSAKYGGLLGNSHGLPITSICQADTITHLSFSLLCIKMFNTSTYTVTDGLTVSLRGLKSASKDPFPAFMRTLKCQGKFEESGVAVQFLWYVDLQGRSVLPEPPLTNIFTINPAFPANKYDIRVSAEYNFYNVPGIPTRTCSSDIRQHDCIRQKKAELISQSCNCWPSTLLGVVNTNKMPTCSDNSANLNSNVLSNVTYLKCGKVADANVSGLCNPDCRAYLYSVDEVDATPTVDLTSLERGINFLYQDVTGSVEITFQSGSLRSLIVESPSMPFTSFACAFGGIIGTYLGGSILALVHIPIFIVAQLTNCVTKRKKVENSEKTDEKTNNLAKEEIYPPVINEAKIV